MEVVELYVLRDFESLIQKPKPNQREPVPVLTATGAYRGGLRTHPSTGYVYLGRNLISERDRGKVTLAKVLKENGIEKRTEINVRVENGPLGDRIPSSCAETDSNTSITFCRPYRRQCSQRNDAT